MRSQIYIVHQAHSCECKPHYMYAFDPKVRFRALERIPLRCIWQSNLQTWLSVETFEWEAKRPLDADIRNNWIECVCCTPENHTQTISNSPCDSFPSFWPKLDGQMGPQSPVVTAYGSDWHYRNSTWLCFNRFAAERVNNNRCSQRKAARQKAKKKKYEKGKRVAN